VTFHKFYCITALCDGCGEKCWETEIAPHFANEREARETLAARYEWRIEREITGWYLMLCVRCADKQDCARYGCEWGYPELDHGSEQQARWDAEHREPLQMCRRCGRVLRDDAPPAGHPDSTVLDLPDEQEELLAHIDELTWPTDADTSPAALNANPINDYTGGAES
jgi:hypothetical protein